MNRLSGLLLLTRPYSWVDAMLNVMLPAVIAGLPLDQQWQAAAVGLLAWWGLNWISEWLQQDVGRQRPLIAVAIAPILGASAIAFHLDNGLISVAATAAFFVLAFLYPWKARLRWLGPIGALIRAAQTGTLVIVGFGIAHSDPRLGWRLITSLMLLQAARSLIADIRDADFDVFELPQVIGKRASKLVALALLLLGLVLFPSVAGATGVRAILALSVAIVVLFPISWSYEAHLVMVLLFSFAKAAAFAGNLNDSLILISAFLASLALALTYWHVPRPSNATFLRHFESGVRLVTARTRNNNGDR